MLKRRRTFPTSDRWTNVREPKPTRASTRAAERRQWARELKKELAEIVWCEQCGVTCEPDIAHRVKRRFIKDRDEYMMAAKLCRACHQGYDEATGPDVHQAMFDGITALILKRL